MFQIITYDIASNLCQDIVLALDFCLCYCLYLSGRTSAPLSALSLLLHVAFVSSLCTHTWTRPCSLPAVRLKTRW